MKINISSWAIHINSNNPFSSPPPWPEAQYWSELENHCCFTVVLLCLPQAICLHFSAHLNITLLDFGLQCATASCTEINFYLKFFHVPNCFEYAAHIQYAHRHTHTQSQTLALKVFCVNRTAGIDKKWCMFIISSCAFQIFFYHFDERKQTKRYLPIKSSYLVCN